MRRKYSWNKVSLIVLSNNVFLKRIKALMEMREYKSEGVTVPPMIGGNPSNFKRGNVLFDYTGRLRGESPRVQRSRWSKTVTLNFTY